MSLAPLANMEAHTTLLHRGPQHGKSGPVVMHIQYTFYECLIAFERDRLKIQYA